MVGREGRQSGKEGRAEWEGSENMVGREGGQTGKEVKAEWERREGRVGKKLRQGEEGGQRVNIPAGGKRTHLSCVHW